jgi:hypothetical protein
MSKEDIYIILTNLAKLRIAETVIRSVIDLDGRWRDTGALLATEITRLEREIDAWTEALFSPKREAKP